RARGNRSVSRSSSGASELSEEELGLALAQAVAQHREHRLEAAGAVCRAEVRPELEPPAGVATRIRLFAVVAGEEELLGLVVGHGEHDRVLRVEAAAELASGSRGGRGAENLEVAKDDPRRRVVQRR